MFASLQSFSTRRNCFGFHDFSRLVVSCSWSPPTPAPRPLTPSSVFFYSCHCRNASAPMENSEKTRHPHTSAQKQRLFRSHTLHGRKRYLELWTNRVWSSRGRPTHERLALSTDSCRTFYRSTPKYSCFKTVYCQGPHAVGRPPEEGLYPITV